MPLPLLYSFHLTQHHCLSSPLSLPPSLFLSRHLQLLHHQLLHHHSPHPKASPLALHASPSTLSSKDSHLTRDSSANTSASIFSHPLLSVAVNASPSTHPSSHSPPLHHLLPCLRHSRISAWSVLGPSRVQVTHVAASTSCGVVHWRTSGQPTTSASTRLRRRLSSFGRRTLGSVR